MAARSGSCRRGRRRRFDERRRSTALACKLHSRAGKCVLAHEQEAPTKGRWTLGDQHPLQRLKTAGKERLAKSVTVGLAPLRYLQSVNSRKMLCDCRDIGVMHDIDGVRSCVDRLLARVRAHIE